MLDDFFNFIAFPQIENGAPVSSAVVPVIATLMYSGSSFCSLVSIDAVMRSKDLNTCSCHADFLPDGGTILF